MRSRSLKTEALVIGTMRLRDADRIVTLYSRDRGRISGVAKGVRRTNSRVGGRLEPFSLVHVILYPGRSLYTVTQVETIRTFQGVRECLFRLEEGSRLLEAVRQLFPEEEEHAGVFNLLVRAVAQLATAPDRAAAAQVVLAARLKLLHALGYAPELGSCVACGSEQYLCAFGPSEGGVLCADCFAGESHDCFSMSAGGIVALRSLLDRPLSEIGVVPLEASTSGEVERAITRTLAYHGH